MFVKESRKETSSSKKPATSQVSKRYPTQGSVSKYFGDEAVALNLLAQLSYEDAQNTQAAQYRSGPRDSSQQRSSASPLCQDAAAR